ncbi:MAG: hypothetical protein PHX25_01540 [Candidatus Pacebacteria bacterium]|nr:hypothetical protein [Candidatus Paceibacterota bacterium]
MKKIITSLLVMTFVMSLGITVFAEENATSTTTSTNAIRKQNMIEVEKRKTIRDTYQQKLNELKERYRENKDQLKSTTTNASTTNASTTTRDLNRQKQEEKRNLIQQRLTAQLKERVRIQNEKIVARFENVIEKLTEIKAKITERITTMEERGIDMTKSKELLNLVQPKIDAAKTAIQNMTAGLATILNSENPKEAYEKAKELANTAKTAIQEAHKSLIDVIASIKASIKIEPTTETATTTPTATTTNTQ